MYVPNFRRCPLPLKLTTSVLNVSKCCMLCPLWQTQLDFFGYIWSCALHVRAFLSFHLLMGYFLKNFY
ncbi:hypothetical protein Hanom_Chr12g01143641 [Helianthus anomalus]